MKFKNNKLILVLVLSLFVVACGKKREELQVFSIPISNGEVSVKNFNIVSTKNQIYIDSNYYLTFQDENINNINFNIYDKNDKFIHSIGQNVDFSRIDDKIKGGTGSVINSSNFRTGDEIKIEVTYMFKDETEKSFTINRILEENKN